MVEADFAVDLSGFTTSRFIRWFDHKYGVVRQQHEWVKVHLMCGVKTNVVTAVEIREKDASDTKLLPDLVNTTAAHFDMREVSADKGYLASITSVIAEPWGYPVYCVQEYSQRLSWWALGEDVSLLRLQPPRVHGTLSQAVQCRIDVLHD